MRADQILQARQWFLDSIRGSEGFRDYVEIALGASALVKGTVAERTTRGIIQQFEVGDTYRVTSPMTDLVEYAASKLDSTDHYDTTLPPTPFGIVRFDRPLTIFDARGETMLAHWVTWGPVTLEIGGALGVPVEKTGILISLWNDMVTEPDSVIYSTAKEAHRSLGDLRRKMGRWAFIGTSLVVDGSPIGPGERYLTASEIEQMALEDAEYAAKTGVDPTMVRPPTGKMTNAGRLMHGLWLLLGQTVTKSAEEYLPRSSRPMLARMQFPKKVTIVSLRRQESRPSEGETRVQWMHRWMVRGHWRNQPYGDGTVRRIWIDPYVKGPEGLPFVQSTKVYVFNR